MNDRKRLGFGVKSGRGNGEGALLLPNFDSRDPAIACIDEVPGGSLVVIVRCRASSIKNIHDFWWFDSVSRESLAFVQGQHDFCIPLYARMPGVSEQRPGAPGPLNGQPGFQQEADSSSNDRP